MTTIRNVLRNAGLEPQPDRRRHQGLDNQIINPPPQGSGEIVCHQRVGGLLKFYRRAA